MSGYTQSDLIGTALTTLFDNESKDLMRKTIQNVRDTSSSNGEPIEVICLRKNQTKFPVKINMFLVPLENKPIVCFLKDITAEKKQHAIVAEEKAKSEHLLRNILPESVALKLKAGESLIAERYADITCFFSDMVGFTKLSSGLNPVDLVGMLNEIIRGFDMLTEKH